MKYRHNFLANILAPLLLLGFLTCIYTFTNVLDGAGMAATFLTNVPIGVTVVTIIGYLIMRFVSKKAWVVTFVGSWLIIPFIALALLDLAL